MTGDISIINVGGSLIGLMDLKKAIEEVKALNLNEQSEIKKILLAKVKSKNYIPGSQEKVYGQSLLREYRKSLGLPVEEESQNGVLSIRILGPGCYTCDKMEKDAREVASELGITADIQHIRDLNEIAEYGPGIYPVLIINNKVYASGKAPSRQQVRNWLEELTGKK